jgi:hypothetical protein
MDPIDSSMAVSVVSFTLLLITQDFISLCRFLKFLDSGFIVTIAIGMIFNGELAVGSVDLCFRSGPLDTEHFVIAGFFGHDSSAVSCQSILEKGE